MDTVIEKPAKVAGYVLHQLVEQMTGGGRPLFADQGDRLLVRTGDARSHTAGEVLAFTLRACVDLKTGGKHRYLPIADWRGRRDWLEKKAAKAGFEVVAVVVTGGMETIRKPARTFRIDATTFTGILKVTDPEVFAAALKSGVGATAKAFGRGMLIVK